MIYIFEVLIFSLIMIIFSFLVNYITDFIYKKKINYFPKHSLSMINGIFLSSSIVYILFVNIFLKYKCKYNN